MLFDTINPADDLILTANSRLARYLQSHFDQHQKQSNKAVWETLRTLPLDRWLEQQFHLSNSNGLLLWNDFQVQCLFEEIISSSPHSKTLWQPKEMARLAKQAFEYLTLWEVPMTSLQDFNAQVETQCLIEWINAFHQKMTEKKAICAASIPALLLSKTLSLPNRIILMGFDEQNPAVKKLFHHIEKKIPVTTETLSVKNADKKQIIVDNTEAEITAMAQWAKAQLEKNPSAQIGCVVPNLGNIRTGVHRIFTDIFCIEHILPGIQADLLPFNISAGISLAKHPMIYTALTLLRWCRRALSIDEIAPLLQSPYLCTTEKEKNNGAQTDAQLRKKNFLHVTLSQTGWRELQQAYQDKKFLKQRPSQWASDFIELLKIAGWPAARTQTSEEFQVLERFKKVLSAFSQLDYIFSTLSFNRALQLLSDLTQETLFQPKSHREPIQIMGALEASGILFDAMWVMGLDDHTWPAASKPHPLIPYAIQQQYDMPHATAKRELQFCKHMTERLENSAKQVIFSSPHKEGDQHHTPSRLIQHIALIDSSQLILANTPSYPEKIFSSQQLETVQDDRAATITSFSHVRGGSKILQQQAECPFRAFSAARLNAKKLENPCIGISPATKGTIIHHVLFYLWGELKDQETLNALDDNALTALIENTIDIVFADPNLQTQLSQNTYFFTVEKKRLQYLIKNWMMIERTRPPFQVIERECNADIKIGALPLKIQLDRVDQLNDGSLLLIDYKTREQSTSDWFDERMTNPQLPIYAVFSGKKDQQYAAVTFAEVDAKKMTLRGVMHENHTNSKNTFLNVTPIDKTKNAVASSITSWETLMQSWRQSLEKLSRDFCEGVARVDPIKKTVCMTCDFKSICRHQMGDQ